MIQKQIVYQLAVFASRFDRAETIVERAQIAEKMRKEVPHMIAEITGDPVEEVESFISQITDD